MLTSILQTDVTAGNAGVLGRKTSEQKRKAGRNLKDGRQLSEAKQAEAEAREGNAGSYSLPRHLGKVAYA